MIITRFVFCYMDDGGVVIFLGAGKVGFRLGWGKPVQIRIQLGHNNYI